MPRVTAELLRSARSGNPDALYEFAMVIETRYKPSYIDIALEHLRVDQLPAADTPTVRWRSHVQTATPSLVCVAASAAACRSDPGARNATVTKIIEGFDGIIGWMDLIMRHWPTFYIDWKQDIASVEGLFSHISLVLSSLIGLENQIALDVFSSGKALSSVHHMWSLNLENHPERTMPITGTCAVIKLVTNIVVHSSSEGKFHLLQSLVSNPSLLCSFCEGLSWRFRNTITYHEQHNLSIDTVARLNSLAIIALLFEKANDPAGSAALRHSGCFRSWTMALIELQGMLSSHLHFHLVTAVTLATNRHGLPAHSVSDMVSAGLIPLFVSSFSKLDWAAHEEVLATVKIIQHLGSLALFPRGNRALHLALKPEYEFPSFLGKGMATGIIGKMWFHLWQGTCLMNTVLSVPRVDLKGAVICDNPFHDPVVATGRERSFGRSRSCSGCHLVVYCGETCQQQDWNERHKYECKSMKRTLDTRKRETVHYSQANRHLHVQMIMEFFCSEFMSILSQFGERAPPSECILVIDAHSGLDWPRAIGDVPFADFATMFFGKFDSPEMEARKEEIIRGFIE